MGEEEKSGADIGVKFAGQEVNVKNIKSLNTVATVATLIVTCTLGVGLYFHEVGAQQEKSQVANTLNKSNLDIAAVLREANVARKEEMATLVKTINDSNEKTISALNKLTNRTSEVACLSDPAIKNRNDARDFCKRISRDDR